MSICDTPMSWDEAKEIIYTNKLEHLYRSTETITKYHDFKKRLICQNDTVSQYIIRERLHWSNNLIPKSTKLFYDSSDFKIINNDFPYNFTSDITHICLWTKTVIHSDPKSEIGDMSPNTKDQIERFIFKLFVEQYGLNRDDLLWFWNFPILQSVKDLSHVHVLIRGDKMVRKRMLNLEWIGNGCDGVVLS